jgi:hypothetical protein
MTEKPSNISFDAVFDADAGVWVATSALGRITTEAPSREALIERLKRIVPDVLESRLVMLRAEFPSSSTGKNYAPLDRLN